MACGRRPTQHSQSDALWHQTQYGDTDVAGGRDHRYRGADDRLGATSMHGGYSKALRQSKNGDVLDHGEYIENAGDLRRQATGPNGWRPTAHDRSDALWDDLVRSVSRSTGMPTVEEFLKLKK